MVAELNQGYLATHMAEIASDANAATMAGTATQDTRNRSIKAVAATMIPMPTKSHPRQESKVYRPSTKVSRPEITSTTPAMNGRRDTSVPRIRWSLLCESSVISSPCRS